MLEMAFHIEGLRRGSLRMDERRIRDHTGLDIARVSLVESLLPERHRVERFIADVYGRYYGAKLSGHYPHLLSVWDADDRILAALGFRLAADAPLFLERYLPEPIETALTRSLGAQAARRDVVEVGNFASTGGVAVCAIVTVAAYLRECGLLYGVITATASLRRSLAAFGISFVELAEARPNALPDRGKSWGSYYRQDPRVIAGAIGATFVRLEPYLPLELNPDLGRLRPQTQWPLRTVAP